MALIVNLRSGKGETIARVEPGASGEQLVETSADRADYPLLRWVDPYSDTIFNQLQMRGLIPELERMERETPEGQHRDFISAVIRLAEQCATLPHHQLVFIGD